MNSRQFLILSSTVIMIIANLFFQQLSQLLLNQFPNAYGKYYEALAVISPEEFTFIIWAPIFIGMLVFAVYQALPAQRDNLLLDKLLFPIVLTNGMNTISLYVDYGWNVLVLVLLLGSLITAFVLVQKAKQQQQVVSFWGVEFPISVFFGWITVAMILTICQSLIHFDWQAWGISASAWSIAVVVVITLVGVAIYKQYQSITYISVLFWAFIGVFAANYGVYPILLVVLVLGMLTLLSLPFVTRDRP